MGSYLLLNTYTKTRAIPKGIFLLFLHPIDKYSGIVIHYVQEVGILPVHQSPSVLNHS